MITIRVELQRHSEVTISVVAALADDSTTAGNRVTLRVLFGERPVSEPPKPRSNKTKAFWFRNPHGNLCYQDRRGQCFVMRTLAKSACPHCGDTHVEGYVCNIRRLSDYRHLAECRRRRTADDREGPRS